MKTVVVVAAAYVIAAQLGFRVAQHPLEYVMFPFVIAAAMRGGPGSLR